MQRYLTAHRRGGSNLFIKHDDVDDMLVLVNSIGRIMFVMKRTSVDEFDAVAIPHPGDYHYLRIFASSMTFGGEKRNDAACENLGEMLRKVRFGQEIDLTDPAPLSAKLYERFTEYDVMDGRAIGRRFGSILRQDRFVADKIFQNAEEIIDQIDSVEDVLSGDGEIYEFSFPEVSLYDDFAKEWSF